LGAGGSNTEHDPVKGVKLRGTKTLSADRRWGTEIEQTGWAGQKHLNERRRPESC